MVMCGREKGKRNRGGGGKFRYEKDRESVVVVRGS